MNASIEETQVKDVMTRVVFTVKPNDKIASVATRFTKHEIHAAPVVDDSNVCVGIITSHDLVEYESMRINVMRDLDRGLDFESGPHPASGSNPFLPASIDEVRMQMTTQVVTIKADVSVESAARVMCQKHVHHLVVLDKFKHPVGMLSSLDILSYITGESVFRKKHKDPD